MHIKPIHIPDSGVQRAYRVRIGILVLFISVVAPLLFVIGQGVQTIRELTAIELARDQWQRPPDILQALNLQEGSSVVDLGSGVGYFTLKLPPIVGNRARFLAGGGSAMQELRELPCDECAEKDR
jgi:hypothetical protein